MAEADSVLLSPSAKYAKRSRYKTKADTYEYKGNTQDMKTSRKRKRRAGSLGNENFHAANVNAERVTLKPNSDKFVFSRSRNSLPLPGQDLPDLTFTKMDYLSKLPRKLQPKPAQSALQEQMEEYIVRREKTEDITRSAPVATSNNRSLTSKSDLYCTRFATDKSQDAAVHESRNDAIAEDFRRIDGGSSWVKDSIDPRVEVFRLPDTNRHASTPVSWSTTPSRKSKPLAQADCSLSGEARLQTCHNHVEPIRQIGQSEPRSTSNGQRQWSKIHHDELTQTLLRKTTENQAVSSDQRAFKKYLSLEDLKHMSKEIRKERSTDGLEIPPQPWQPSPSGRTSASAPSPMQRLSFNLNDVVPSQHNQRDLLSRNPVQQNQALEAHESDQHEYNYAAGHHPYMGKGAQESGWCTVPAHVPVRQRAFVMQGLQNDLNSHRMGLPPSAKSLSYTQLPKPDASLYTDEYDVEYPASADERLDAFDLELLETIRMTGPDRGSPTANGSKSLQVDSASFIDFTTQHAILKRNGNNLASFLGKSPVEQGLFQIPSIRSTWEEEQNLVLDRPSLRRHGSTQQEFNPFQRSYILL